MTRSPSEKGAAAVRRSERHAELALRLAASFAGGILLFERMLKCNRREEQAVTTKTTTVNSIARGSTRAAATYIVKLP